MNKDYCPNCHINAGKDYIFVIRLDLGEHDKFVAIYTIFFFLGILAGFSLLEINLFSFLAAVPSLMFFNKKYTCQICGVECNLKEHKL